MGRIPYKYNDVFSKSLLPLIDSCYVPDIAGSPGWVIINKKIPFVVTLSGLKRSTDTPIKFIVEYYDDFTGNIRLDYDYNNLESSIVIGNATSTNTWKIVQIQLDCRLNNLFTSDSNADFRLFASSNTLPDRTLKLRRLGMLYMDTQVTASWQTVGLESIVRETFLVVNNSGSGTSIDDNVTSLDSTWSSTKINSEIVGSSGSSINDELVNTINSWSSSKTSTEINALISDTTTVTDKTWSSSKTNTTIQNAISGVTAGTSSGGSTVLKCNSTDGTPAASYVATNGLNPILDTENGVTSWNEQYPTEYIFHTMLSYINKGKNNQELFGFYNPDYPSLPFFSLELSFSGSNLYVNVITRSYSDNSNEITTNQYYLGFNSALSKAYPLTHVGVVYQISTMDIYLILNGVVSTALVNTNSLLLIQRPCTLHIGKNFEGNMHYFAIHGNNFITLGTFPQKYTIPTRDFVTANCRHTNGNTLYYDMQKRFNNYSTIYDMFKEVNTYSQEAYEDVLTIDKQYHLTMGSSGSFVDNPFPYM